jgi:hypothetical protein
MEAMTEHPFAAEADFVKRATGLHGAIAADLVTAGGILRCSICGTERSVGDIASHLRSGWPECCGQTMTWVTLKMLAAERWGEIPEGYGLAVVESEGWRVETGRRCCRRGGGRSGACGAPSMAALNRGKMTRYRGLVPSWWPYCGNHSYGNWIENGQVMHWILREAAESKQYVRQPRRGDVIRTGRYGDVTVDSVIRYGRHLLVTDAGGGQHALQRADGEQWLRVTKAG